jgi:hypothetical protein
LIAQVLQSGASSVASRSLTSGLPGRLATPSSAAALRSTTSETIGVVLAATVSETPSSA